MSSTAKAGFGEDSKKCQKIDQFIAQLKGPKKDKEWFAILLVELCVRQAQQNNLIREHE
jgi:hypothetical protein